MCGSIYSRKTCEESNQLIATYGQQSPPSKPHRSLLFAEKRAGRRDSGRTSAPLVHSQDNGDLPPSRNDSQETQRITWTRPFPSRHPRKKQLLVGCSASGREQVVQCCWRSSWWRHVFNIKQQDPHLRHSSRRQCDPRGQSHMQGMPNQQRSPRLR